MALGMTLLLWKDFCHWGCVQGSGVGGLLLDPLFTSRCTAIQVAGLIELPCAAPSKGACEAGGGVGLSGVAVGVVEMFLSAIDDRHLRVPREPKNSNLDNGGSGSIAVPRSFGSLKAL